MIRALIIGILSAGALTACAATPSHLAGRNGSSAAPPAACAAADGKAQPGSSACFFPTRTYTGRQLRQTGRTDAAHALGMLDPSITVHGN